MIGSLPTSVVPLYAPHGTPGRRLLAAILRAASRALARLAHQVAVTERRSSPYVSGSVIEFYAEAGAPEGALYVDGQLVGHLSGVTRL
ncbi:MAG: hypothetical protein IPO19_00960 [Rhodoferax sp.]|nr:hypothetical protein [Rhodoferax sp.]MBK9234686.1 hypothetical protein [Rhodoferax sp.]